MSRHKSSAPLPAAGADYYANGYQLQNAGKAWSHAYDAANDDRRFEVRPGDVWIHDQPYAERSEITNLVAEPFRKPVSVRYRFMVEPGAPNTSDRVVIGQFHETPDAGDLAVRPCFAMELKGERMRAWVRYTPAAQTTAQPTEILLFSDAANIVRGRWYDIEIQIQFDPFGAGRCAVLRDGALLATYAGPLGSNDAKGPYWKEGIYRAACLETLAVHFAGLTITAG